MLRSFLISSLSVISTIAYADSTSSFFQPQDDSLAKETTLQQDTPKYLKVCGDIFLDPAIGWATILSQKTGKTYLVISQYPEARALLERIVKENISLKVCVEKSVPVIPGTPYPIVVAREIWEQSPANPPEPPTPPESLNK
jgi:hypothetical protein